MMKRTLTLLLLTVVLTSCASRKEIPEKATGVDEQRLSPCACIQLDYRPGGYRWLG